MPFRNMRYGYAWATLFLFVFSLAGHWLFGWYAFTDEQREHHQAVEAAPYVVEMLRDTFENWQSEFLQLLWQVGGLAVLLYMGSPQSKENSERSEEKLNEILRRLAPEEAERLIRDIDRRFENPRYDLDEHKQA